MFDVRLFDLRRDQWLFYGFWGLVLLLSIRFVHFGIAAAIRPSDGFAAYYTAARLLREGINPSYFYDDAWFRRQVARYHPAADDIYNVNPPTTALLLLPLTGLDYTGARIAWTLFSLCCLIGAGGWLLWLLRLRGVSIPGFIVLVLLYQPLYANFNLGQAYALLFGLLVLVWYGYRQRNDPFLGIVLGLIFVLKTACAPLWLLLASQRRWRALAWATATVLLADIGSLPWLGSEGWRTYFRLLAEFSSQPWLAVTAYQTQLSFWRHLFSFDAQWNPAPLFAAPILAVWLPWLTLSLLLGVGINRARTRKQDDLTFAGFVILSIILSPVSLDYHYLLLLVPIAILLAWGCEQPTPWVQSVWAVAVLLIAVNLPYQSQYLAAGAWALLAYPKLYGALALCGLVFTNE